MARNVKALRALALLTAMSGAAALSLFATSTSAKASEERLHNETFTTYGLLPPGSIGKASSSTEGGDSVTSNSVSIASSFQGKGPNLKGNSNEPELEDPGLPGYDGPDASPASARSAAR